MTMKRKIATLCFVAATFLLLLQTAVGKQIAVLLFILAGASLGMALFLVFYDKKKREA